MVASAELQVGSRPSPRLPGACRGQDHRAGWELHLPTVPVVGGYCPSSASAWVIKTDTLTCSARDTFSIVESAGFLAPRSSPWTPPSMLTSPQAEGISISLTPTADWYSPPRGGSALHHRLHVIQSPIIIRQRGTMARTARTGSAPARGRRRSGTGGTGSVVGQISQIVAANQELQRQRQDLQAENDRLRRELTEIGAALGQLTGGGRRGRGRRGSEVLGLAEVKAKRQRKPITDPELLERRRQALAKARAARAEKLAAARTDGTGSADTSEG